MRLNRGVMLSVFTALCAFALSTDALAQSAFYPKSVAVGFVRNSSAADNPLSSTGQTVYTTYVANGTHGTATAGIAAVNPTLTDTSAAIFIGDHWAKSAHGFRAVGVLPSDSTVLGTLFLKGLSSTIDTVIILRDVSYDGITWVIADSIGGHAQSATAQVVTGAVSDSIEFIMPSQSGAGGAVGTALAVGLTCNPWMNTAGITAQALVGINYIRFRLHMTSGDYAAAGASRGITAQWVYPAVDANANQPGRFNPN